MRISGLILLILIEVRGPVWITTFVTQGANQLQIFANMLPYAPTSSILPNRKFGVIRRTGVTLHCLSLNGKMNTLCTFGLHYSVTSTVRSLRRPLNLWSDTLRTPKILPEGYSL